MNVDARPARLADLRDLSRWQADAQRARAADRGGAELDWLDPRPAIAAADLERLDALVAIGCIDAIGFGFAHASVVQHGAHRVGRLFDLYVQPAARGVGVGEALFEHVTRWAAEQSCRGIDSLVLPGNRDGKNFFERFGMVARAIAVYRPVDPGPER